MRHTTPSRFAQSGFTLVELSIVIIIVSLLMASGLAVGTSMVQQANYIDTQKKLAQIRQSIHDFYVVNGRLPCVARLDLLPTDPNFGREINCAAGQPGTSESGTIPNVRTGMVPMRTLGLTDRAGADSYGNRIYYAVTANLAINGSFGGSPGGIIVSDGSSLTTPNTIVSNAAYMLVSPGADRKGAFSYATAGFQPCTAGNLDTLNCVIDDEVFRDAPYNSGDIANRFFDDIVDWAPKFHFMALDTETTSLWVTSPSPNQQNIYSVGTDDSTATTNVGIGTSNPAHRLHVYGDIGLEGATRLYPQTLSPATFAYFSFFHNNFASANARIWTLYGEQATGDLVLRPARDDGTHIANDLLTFHRDSTLSSPATYSNTTGSAANVYINSSGKLYRSTSSRRFKTDIQDYEGGLDKLDLLRPVTFHSTIEDDTRLHAGFIAEEVDEAGLTEFVSYDKEGKPDGLHYGHMTALLAKAMQEMDTRLTAVEAAKNNEETNAPAASAQDENGISLGLIALILASASLLLQLRRKS